LSDLTLQELGWGEPFASAFEQLPRDGLVPARVTAVHRGRVALAPGDAQAVPAGTVRDDPPAVGDWVAFDPAAAAVRAVLPRRGALRRRRSADEGRAQVLAANVDVAFVVSALDRGVEPRRVERLVAVAAAGGAEPVLVLTKADVVPDPGPALGAARAAAPGVPVVVLSARTGAGLDALLAWLAGGRTGVLLGASGAGKSTLVNALLGAERQAVAPVRERDAEGRHTTTHRELFALPRGGLLVDTPGLRLPLLWAGDDDAPSAAFADIEDLAARCRFRDCTHRDEPGCAVRAAVESGELPAARLAALERLRREEAWARDRDDPAALAARRARTRAIHRAYNRLLRD
jgi:ribosome biogenesis GTPase